MTRESALRRLTPSRFFEDVLPLGAGVLLSALYFRIDVYFIEQWHGLEAVGGYNAVFRLVEALRLLPAAVMAVTFPMLVQTADTRLVRRIGGALAVAGVGARAGRARLARSLIVPLDLRRAVSLHGADVCDPRARAAAVLPQLRADASGDRLGWPARLPADRRARARRERRRELRARAVAGHDRRRDRDAPHRSRRHRGLPVCAAGPRAETVDRSSANSEERRHDADARTGARRPALGRLRVALRLSADARRSSNRA